MIGVILLLHSFIQEAWSGFSRVKDNVRRLGYGRDAHLSVVRTNFSNQRQNAEEIQG